jgi:hypothetical protein
MPNPLDPGELLRRMALQVAEFAQSTTVTEALKPFDDGILEDPLFTWCVKYKCHYEPSTLILLNNWDKDRGTNRTTGENRLLQRLLRAYSADHQGHLQPDLRPLL